MALYLSMALLFLIFRFFMGATVSATFWPVFMAYLAVLQYAGLLCHWQIAQILA